MRLIDQSGLGTPIMLAASRGWRSYLTKSRNRVIGHPTQQFCCGSYAAWILGFWTETERILS